MPEMTHCPKCGARLSPGLLGEVCPNCALQAAFEFRGPNADVPEPITQVGPYRLMEKIGEGGLGVVYMAEQREPIRMRVAIKLIKPGMDSREVIARFEAERQALAMMDHPNIARIFNAGTTENGHPYFAMELVRGMRITEYCDSHNLSTRERLDLFIIVAQAVQHAHQKGIIHRDLKPSNILVTVNDGIAVPKIIDFGIAKATQQPLTEKTLFTRFNQLLGTPAYMSPEQAELTTLDIDTRTDIYSLGVLLYELLTGHTPFDAKELFKAGLEHMLRTIRETEPPRPSAHLGTLTDAALTTLARQRGTEPPKLIHAVRGDLDWIVMKCLEKDRSRRYETANGLAADIKRHLRQEPIGARPPKLAYRIEKFVHRHRLAVSAAAAVTLALIAATAISAGSWRRAVKAGRSELEQRQHAEAKAAAEARAKAEATEQRDRALQILHASLFLAESGLRETNLTYAPEILSGLREAIAYQPTNAALWRSRGLLLSRTGEFDAAFEHLSKAIELASIQNERAVLTDSLLRRSELLRKLDRGAEAGLDERRARGLPYQHLSLQALPDYQRATNVSIELGATNRESGLYALQGWDSKNTPKTIDGEEACFFKAGWNYGYFFIDPTFKWALGPNVLVRVEYRVVRGKPMGLHYDGAGSSYASANEWALKPSLGKWQVIEFLLRDARFRNSQNGGADFRVYDNENGFYVRRITVSRYERAPPRPRDPSLSSNLIDLTRFYASSLRHYTPAGEIDQITNVLDAARRKTGVEFDARGYIGLYCRSDTTLTNASVLIRGIPIARRASRLHFLHSAGYAEADGTKIGSYFMQLADGSRHEFPILYGRNVRSQRGDYKPTPEAEVAWEGEGYKTLGGSRVRIFKTTWVNPRPDLQVLSLDFVSTKTKSSPHLLAITADPSDAVVLNPAAATDTNSRRLKNIPERPAQTPSALIDLSVYYNAALHEDWHGKRWPGNNLANLPTGIQSLGSIQFDVRGVIQLAGRLLDEVTPGFPEGVRSIPIERQCERLHFLHATGWGNYVTSGSRIGSYVMHFADGKSEELPLRTNEDLAEWQGLLRTNALGRAEVVWTGQNARGLAVQLFKRTWTNPRPEVQIDHLDFISDGTDAAPFLIAITAEP